jgi:hypothetical protein
VDFSQERQEKTERLDYVSFCSIYALTQPIQLDKTARLEPPDHRSDSNWNKEVASSAQLGKSNFELSLIIFFV